MQNDELRRVQSELDVIRLRYFDLFDLAPAGYLTVDESGLILEANLTAGAMLGVDRLALSKQPFTRFIFPEDQDVYYIHGQRLAETMDPQSFELRLTREGAGPFWALLETLPLDDKTKAPCRIMFTDISARKLAEEKLAERDKELMESKERFRLLAENSSDVVIQESEGGTIEWITDGGARALGWDIGDLIGRPVIDLVHMEDRDAFRGLRPSIQGGEDGQVNLRILNRGGGAHWFCFSQRPLNTQGGQPVKFVLNARNVQKEVEAKASLEEERDRLRATWDSFIDPHVMVDAVRGGDGEILDFVFVEANAAACAYNKTDRVGLIGRRVTDLLPAHESSGLMDMYREVIETGNPLSLDNFVYPHDIYDAEKRHYDIRAVKVGDSLSYTWRDVTDRQRAALELEIRSKTDELTQLLNRKEVFDRMEALSDVTRTGKQIAALFCDFGDFKSINDTYGHVAGDEVLRIVAGRIRACLRSTDDLGARVGGDEMLIVLHGVRGLEDAENVADKLRFAASEPVVMPDGSSIVAAISVGVALALPGEKPDALIARADAAMYRSKKDTIPV